MIRLRFSTELTSLLSAVIRWRTDSDISHVEFEREDGWTLGARFSWLSSKGGVQLRPPSANRHQSHIVHATFPGIEKAYAWCLANELGRAYDLRGILGIAVGRQWMHNKTSRFCSEMVDNSAWQGAGVRFLRSAPNVITPRDIFESTELTIL